MLGHTHVSIIKVQCLTAAMSTVLNCAMQERPDDVPMGELPQTMKLLAERHLVDKSAPGRRVTVFGVYRIRQVAISSLPCTDMSPLLAASLLTAR